MVVGLTLACTGPMGSSIRGHLHLTCSAAVQRVIRVPRDSPMSPGCTDVLILGWYMLNGRRPSRSVVVLVRVTMGSTGCAGVLVDTRSPPGRRSVSFRRCAGAGTGDEAEFERRQQRESVVDQRTCARRGAPRPSPAQRLRHEGRAVRTLPSPSDRPRDRRPHPNPPRCASAWCGHRWPT